MLVSVAMMAGLAATTVAAVLSVEQDSGYHYITPQKRNLVMMVSDGFGSASESMARGYVQQMDNKPYEWLSALDKLYVGLSRTKSADTLVTDSAAGATVFSCGKKTYNGAIGVTSDEKPCGTVLEAAKDAGYTTALVVTSRITHATPAAFAAHVVDRGMEELIAQQLVGNNTLGNKVDLMFGGGKCFFQPNSTPGSCRSDSMDVWTLAKDSGYTSVSTRAEFDMLETSATLPLIGLFTQGHMAYNIDRNPTVEPSLTEMAMKALNILLEHTRDSPTGFFIMIEGSRIDMAGHDNDPTAHLHDIIEYWETVTAVQGFVDRHPNTAMVSTSDHETGGLTLGVDPEYVWHPRHMQGVKKSAEVICAELRQMLPDKRTGFAQKVVIPEYLGITNASNQSVAQIVNGAAKGEVECKHAVGHVVSKLAHLGWSTGGHTGADVGLYAYGKGTESLRGNIENTQVGEFLARYLEVDLDQITRRLENETTTQPGYVWARNLPSIVKREDRRPNSHDHECNDDTLSPHSIDVYHQNYRL
ncbi:vacuolar alkaline phosphatase [Kickxella alabastrina]|nr:vacuolar alkaline phosphatase [Kickxella alabastrina]